MYSKRTGLILGFHGCDESVRDKVISEKGILLNPSENDYDWLGNGVYFWENNCKRAMDFAIFLKENPPHNKKQKISPPLAFNDSHSYPAHFGFDCLWRFGFVINKRDAKK